jgi:hypothetical protein
MFARADEYDVPHRGSAFRPLGQRGLIAAPARWHLLPEATV